MLSIASLSAHVASGYKPVAPVRSLVSAPPVVADLVVDVDDGVALDK